MLCFAYSTAAARVSMMMPPFAVPHRRDARLHPEPGALEIDAERAIPAFFRRVLDPRAPGNPGVVHERRQPSEDLLRLRDRALPIGDAGDVERLVVRAQRAGARVELPHERWPVVVAHVADDDVRALAHERLGLGAADTLHATGDDRDLAGKREHVSAPGR